MAQLPPKRNQSQGVPNISYSVSRRVFYRRLRIVALALLLGFGASIAVKWKSASHYDLLIKGGTVIDGSGRKGIVADVGIKDHKIAFVGRAWFAGADRVIDASGKIVAPGFIDTHTHNRKLRKIMERRDRKFSQSSTEAWCGAQYCHSRRA
jgi:hypothetical protein